MPSLSAALRARSPVSGWVVADLAWATAAALTLMCREAPIIGVVTSTGWAVPSTVLAADDRLSA